MTKKIDVKKTVIIAQNLTRKPEKPETDLQIRIAGEEEFAYFERCNEYSSRDVQVLRDADVCIVVTDGDDIIHYNCTMLDSFQHPTTPFQIQLGETAAYGYKIWTAKSYRGRGIYQKAHAWRRRYVYDRGVRCLYGQVDSQNTVSLKATQKAGWEVAGERHTIKTGEFNTHIITGENIFANSTELTTQLGDIAIVKTRDNRFKRIENEFKEYINKWTKHGYEVVLFGSGNHAQEIINRTDLGSLVNYAVDEAASKVGSSIPNSNINVYSADKLSNENPDVIIICSEAFQNAMASQAREKSDNAKIIALYPHVSRVDGND